MKCPIETGETAETLLAYASRKLDAGTAAVLEKHMEICPACREFAAGQRAVWEALDVWEAAPVSSDFDRRLYRRIAERVSWWELLIRPLRPAMARRFVAVAAVACTVLLASLLLDRPVGPPPAPAAAQVEAVQPDQVEHALDDMDMLAQFERSVRADGASPRI
jgi:anti-sigma factor RsiW